MPIWLLVDRQERAQRGTQGSSKPMHGPYHGYEGPDRTGKSRKRMRVQANPVHLAVAYPVRPVVDSVASSDGCLAHILSSINILHIS